MQRIPESRIAATTLMLLTVLSSSAAQGQTARRSNVERRSEYFRQQRQYPFAQMPAQGRRLDMIARYRGASLFGPQPSTIDDGDWRAMGPGPIGTVDAGRVAALAIDPRNSQVIYAGAAQGGVWKSTNGGTSWSALTDTQCSLAIGALVLDPLNPDIVYAGTGEQNYSGDSFYGCGVLKSTNGGTTWTILGSSIFDTSTGGARTGRIAIIPDVPPAASSSVLLAATTFGLYRSADAGNTWTRVIIAGNPNSQATDVAVHPRNPTIVYAAFTSTGFNVANGIYKSTDGGVTFPTRLTAGLPTANVGRITFAIAPSGPDTMYVAVHNTSTSGLLGIWRSIDGGTSWTQATAQNANCGTQCWYDIVIAVDPTNAGIVYFGGVRLFRSADAAETFTNIGNPIHVDHHAFAFDPVAPSTIYAGSDGGVYRSANSGTAWTSLNANLTITQFYHGLSFTSDGLGMLGGTQDNGTGAFTGGVSWPRVIGGDGGFTAVNPLTGMAYGETQWTPPNTGGPIRAASYTGPFNQLMVNGINRAETGLFIPPLEMDNARPHTLYFGTARVYRTRDDALNWSVINATPGRVSTASASAIAPAQSDSNVVYLGSNDGNVQVTIDGGATWNQRATNLPARFVTDFAVHRSNPNIAYVTFSGFQTPHVWKTTDAGGSWTNISSILPDMPVNGIALLPDGSLYVGTDLGAYRSRNDGLSWEPFGNGLPNVAVFDLVYHAPTRTLIAGTHGRSIFATSVTAPPVPRALAVPATPLGGAGVPFVRPAAVSVVGAAGDLVEGAFDAVTVALASGSGVLSGTTTVAARNGIATFSDLIITGSGTFTLRFSASNLDPVTSTFSLLGRRGDVTNDNLITAADADAILRHIVKLPAAPSSTPLPNGDANCDGAVNAVDAAIVLAFAAGRDVSRFCVGKFVQ
jgi:photosystem II stability/assembly factor-like uncharacterized protein